MTNDVFQRAAAKVAIVTGAASGIGKALATHLVDLGWFVACCDILEEAGSDLVTTLGSQAVFLKCDVSNYQDQVRVFTQVWEKWGRLDALLANAGHSDRDSIYILAHKGKTDIPPEPALKSIKACYESFLYGVQLSIHFMRRNETPGGYIIATSSIASIHPHQTFPEYCGAKAAVRKRPLDKVLNSCLLFLTDQSICLNSSLHSWLEGEHHSECCIAGIVITGAVPQASIDATLPDHITSTSTVVKAYDMCLADRSINGQLIECSVDKQIFLSVPEMANGAATKRACTVWEPLFEQKHHEKSGLPYTIL